MHRSFHAARAIESNRIRPNPDENWNFQSPSNKFAKSGITLPIEPVAELEAVDHNLIPDNGPQISAHQGLDAARSCC